MIGGMSGMLRWRTWGQRGQEPCGGRGSLVLEATVQRMLAQVRSNSVLAGSMVLPWVRP